MKGKKGKLIEAAQQHLQSLAAYPSELYAAVARIEALLAIAEELRAAREPHGVVLYGGKEYLGLDHISHAEWGTYGKLYVDMAGYPPRGPMILLGGDAQAVAEALGMAPVWDDEEAGDGEC